MCYGSLDAIVLGHRFTVLQNFWADAYREPGRIGSGLMAWDCDLSGIYESFRHDADRYLAEYKTKAKWGDQGFIKDHAPVEPERWQTKCPGRIVSFKKHVRPSRGVPAGASVVCFHGQPRPWALAPFERAWFEKHERLNDILESSMRDFDARLETIAAAAEAKVMGSV